MVEHLLAHADEARRLRAR